MIPPASCIMVHLATDIIHTSREGIPRWYHARLSPIFGEKPIKCVPQRMLRQIALLPLLSLRARIFGRRRSLRRSLWFTITTFYARTHRSRSPWRSCATATAGRYNGILLQLWVFGALAIRFAFTACAGAAFFPRRLLLRLLRRWSWRLGLKKLS